MVIDSLNGYMNAVPEERALIVQLHELLSFLNNHGVATFLVAAHASLLSPTMRNPVDASYLADAVVWTEDAVQCQSRVIAVTGWGAEEDRRRTRAAGFDHHLTKPVGIESIEAILARR